MNEFLGNSMEHFQKLGVLDEKLVHLLPLNLGSHRVGKCNKLRE